jgi:hypothetical protein
VTILYRLRALARWIFRRDEIEQVLNSDLEDYIERSAAEKMRTGMSEAEARRVARIELGGVEQTKERVRATLALGPVDSIISDAQYALRVLCRQKLVEYGSYDCPHCRAANERIADVRRELGDRIRYVFRHRPILGSDLARRAAELVETATDEASFWQAHALLMTRSEQLIEEDLRFAADMLSGEAGAADSKGPVRVGLSTLSHQRAPARPRADSGPKSVVEREHWLLEIERFQPSS